MVKKPSIVKIDVSKNVEEIEVERVPKIAPIVESPEDIYQRKIKELIESIKSNIDIEKLEILIKETNLFRPTDRLRVFKELIDLSIVNVDIPFAKICGFLISQKQDGLLEKSMNKTFKSFLIDLNEKDINLKVDRFLDMTKQLIEQSNLGTIVIKIG